MPKNESVLIEKLVLDLGGKKVELTIEQARRLFRSMAELFGEKEVHHHHDRYWWDRPWRWPTHLISSGTLSHSKYASLAFDQKSSTLQCKV